ncbi:hypothetical protein EXW39_27820 (plasmid) [Bacillus mycoides]|uniref:hypothetical protein n=1 Tax=Bacillus mycoides TaxID=1405 RepID=UPI001C01D557|nr:hypothetical protein [Bacillus mycoides]QWH63914.1 hypothetical protein EXW39_27820 [Bacillus mycoides]
MPWFLNTNTDVTWEVTDADHIKRCKNDPVYEEADAVKEIGEQTVSTTNEIASVLESFKKTYNVEQMKDILTERGVSFHSKATKDELAVLLLG